jgi:hypothetical protein
MAEKVAFPFPISISAEGAAGWAVLLLLVLCMGRSNCSGAGGSCCGSCRQSMNLSQDGYDFVASQAVDQCRLEAAIAAVNDLVTACLRQDQFDALVDFAYTITPQEFAQSRVLQLVNECDYEGAAQQLAYMGFRSIACLFSQQPSGYLPKNCPPGTALSCPA